MRRNTFVKISAIIVLIIVLVGFITFIFSLYYNYINETYLCQISHRETLFNSLNSLISPFVSIVAIVLTFIAFYIQYDFNVKQTQYLISDKIDKKVDEYIKILDSLISNDTLKDMDVRIILESSMDNLVRTYKQMKLIEDDNFTNMIFTSYVNKSKIFKIIEDNLIKKPENTRSYDLKVYRKQIEIIMDVYMKFYFFIISFDNELDSLKVTEKEKYISSFFLKFELLYHNFDEGFLYIIFYRFQKMREGDNKQQTYINSILKNYFRHITDLYEVEHFVDYALKKPSK